MTDEKGGFTGKADYGATLTLSSAAEFTLTNKGWNSMETELILQLDEKLIKQMETYARYRGKSISQIVREYFALLVLQNEELPPITKSLRGVLKSSDKDEQHYKRYLEEKYL